jgi:hypothetical protein
MLQFKEVKSKPIRKVTLVKGKLPWLDTDPKVKIGSNTVLFPPVELVNCIAGDFDKKTKFSVREDGANGKEISQEEFRKELKALFKEEV